MGLLLKVHSLNLRGIKGNALTKDIGLLLLRVVTGTGFVFLFEKVLPRGGVWGPEEWSVTNVAAMGFPLPLVFAWMAVLSEFVGGLLIIGGMWTRYAAAINTVVTFVAAFIFHGGAVTGSGFSATLFFVLCLTLTISGPGRFSLDAQRAI